MLVFTSKIIQVVLPLASDMKSLKTAVNFQRVLPLKKIQIRMFRQHTIKAEGQGIYASSRSRITDVHPAVIHIPGREICQSTWTEVGLWHSVVALVATIVSGLPGYQYFWNVDKYLTRLHGVIYLVSCVYLFSDRDLNPGSPEYGASVLLIP